MSLTRAQIRTTPSRDKSTNHEVTTLPEVGARANLMDCPCVHLVKPMVNVHMTPGGTAVWEWITLRKMRTNIQYSNTKEIS